MSKYDDLDDILDDFEEQDRVLGPAATEGAAQTAPEPVAATPATPSMPSAPTTAATTDAAATKSTADGLEDEFAQKLSLGMEELTQALEADPNARAELEVLMASLGVKGDTKGDPTRGPGGEPVSFEDTISQTMGRLNESKQSVDEKLTGGDDFLEKMLGDLQNATGGAGGGDMDALLATLMEELSTKDVLYEPLKEMHDKYPEWLKLHGPTLPPAELIRYNHQQQVVADIINKFEDPKYSDDNKECRAFISEKMMEMQETGSPPQELVGEMAEGTLPMFGQSAQPECPMQ